MMIPKLFENEEMRDIIVSILLISLLFAAPEFTENFIPFLVIVIFSFFVREIGHRFVAKKFGCTVTYKILPTGFFISVMFLIFRVFAGGMSYLIFIIPGFVEVMPYSFGRWGFKITRLTSRDSAIIAMSGVGMNLFLAFFFKLLTGDFFQMLSYVNATLAFFNLFPLKPLDGGKIFTFSIWIWLTMIIMSFLMMFIF